VIYERRESGIALQDVIRVPDDEVPRRIVKSKPMPRVKKEVKKRKVEARVPVPPPVEIQVVNYATKQEEYQRRDIFDSRDCCYT